MAVKVRVGNSRGAKRPLGLWLRIVRAGFLLLVACTLVGGAVFAYYYFQYQKVVDDRLAAGPMFASVAQIYGAPREVRTGQKLDVELIAQDLRQAGYNANPRLGTFSVNGDSISIHPGPESYHAPDGATIAVAGGEVQSITADNGASLRSYRLEPKLITGLSEDKNRIKRRLVTYDDIPKVLVDAVLAIEDRRFFEHSGLNYGRLAECAVEDIEAQKMSCGGSTITQQLARGFFLSRDKKISRKLEEILITFQLEARFNKQQIFEMYANEINLGQRGSYGINGFGEASQAFLGKNIRQLTLADAALLAGLIQNPNRRNPYRHPDRATERRNVVLDSMVETGAITASEAEHAKAQPLRLAPPNVDASEAPYFVDLVHDQLVQRIGDQDLGRQNLRIYTSLDPELQRAASEAVDIGMRNVDEMVRKGNHGTALPQVALIALDPHTGQVLALVGGRNYGISQLNHAVAKRPTGSIFKPFVYAAAYVQSLDGRSLSGQPVASLDGSDDPDAPPSPGSTGVFTALTKLNDVQTTFTFDNGRQSYTPRDFKSEYHGEVTATYALAHSLNNATISLGQEVGFENVAALARASGITAARGTPAVALGSYDATPLDMAGAYTVFANNGVHLNPWMLASVRNDAGDVVADFAPEAKQVMDVRRRHELRLRYRRTSARLHRASRRQNRHIARRMVCRLQLQSDLHRLDRQRRLYRRETARRARRRTHLGGVHETRHQAPAVLRHAGVRRARRRAGDAHRQGHQHARRLHLRRQQLHCGLPDWHSAAGNMQPHGPGHPVAHQSALWQRLRLLEPTAAADARPTTTGVRRPTRPAEKAELLQEDVWRRQGQADPAATRRTTTSLAALNHCHHWRGLTPFASSAGNESAIGSSSLALLQPLYFHKQE
jgi:penicillin-binding protein 1B